MSNIRKFAIGFVAGAVLAYVLPSLGFSDLIAAGAVVGFLALAAFGT